MGFLHSKRAYPWLKPLTSMCVCVCVCVCMCVCVCLCVKIGNTCGRGISKFIMGMYDWRRWTRFLLAREGGHVAVLPPPRPSTNEVFLYLINLITLWLAIMGAWNFFFFWVEETFNNCNGCELVHHWYTTGISFYFQSYKNRKKYITCHPLPPYTTGKV